MEMFKNTVWWKRTVLSLLLMGVLLFCSANGLALQQCDTSPDTICSSPSTATDCDQDGLSDYEECRGFTVLNMSNYCVDGYDVNNNSCVSGSLGITLDPSLPDLIYTLTNEAKDDLNQFNTPNSLLLAALGTDSNNALNIYKDGLSIRTHRIDYAKSGFNRWLTAKVRAAWIQESSGTTEYLGKTASDSVPSDADAGSTIYTAMIAKEVNDNCGGEDANKDCAIAGTNVNNINGSNTPIINFYILEVAAHEMSHGTRLAPTNEKSYFHYRRTGTIMDPAASFKNGLYNIYTDFTPNDPLAVQLKK